MFAFALFPDSVVSYRTMLVVILVYSVVVFLLFIFFSICGGAMFPTALLHGARFLLGQDSGNDSGAAVLTVDHVVDLLGQVLSRQLAVLLTRTGVLTLDDDARRDVLELDGGVGLVLLEVKGSVSTLVGKIGESGR